MIHNLQSLVFDLELLHGLDTLLTIVWSYSTTTNTPITIYQLPYLLGRQFHRIHNMLIASAATQVARKRVTDFIFCGVWILFQEGNHGHEDAWRAVATLQTVCFPK